MSFSIKWDDWNRPPEGTLVFKDIALVGTTYDNRDGTSRQQALSSLKSWVVVKAVREPSNPYDSNAVAIVSEFGQVGYIDKDSAGTIAPIIDKGATALAKLSAVFKCHDNSIGAKVELHLSPPNEHERSSTPKTDTAKQISRLMFEMKVVGINGDNCLGHSNNDIAAFLVKGERVSFELNDYEEKIFVESASGPFGYLSKKDYAKMRKYIDSCSDIHAWATKVDVLEEDKTSVTVKVVIAE